MKQYYVYILLCSDNSFYTGITNNLERRLAEHNSGCNPNSYTYNRRPLQLVYSEVFPQPMAAIRREKQIKNWSRAKKLALIKSDEVRLHELAKCRNDTSSERKKG